MAQDFPAYALSDPVATQLDALKKRTESLQSGFSGTTAPSMVNGEVFYDTDDHKFYYQRDGVLKEVGTMLDSDIDLDATAAGTPHQIKNARLENLGSDEAPGANELGRVYHHTGEEKAKIIVSATKRETIYSAGTGDYLPIELPLGAWVKGSTPPTDATKDFAAGWLFDATAEFALANIRVPQGIAATTDLKLRLRTCLNAAETGGEDEEWKVSWVSIQPNNAESILGATASIATVAEDLSVGDGVDEADVHTIDVTIPYNDATNPIVAGDIIFLKLQRNEVTNIPGVIFLGATLLVPAGKKITEV